MTTTLNYAEALETEAYEIARRRLIRAAEQTGQQDRLDGWLSRLALIHENTMEAAHQWTQPDGRYGRLTPEHVSDGQVAQVAINAAAAAQEG